MSKLDQAKFTKNKAFEIAFKKRYGKDVEVLSALTIGESGILEKSSVHILTPLQKYVITEILDGEGKTDHAFSGKDGAPHKYRTYLEAEVFIADLIGDEDGNIK